MFSTDFIFRQQENLVDNQKCQAGLSRYETKYYIVPSSHSVPAVHKNWFQKPFWNVEFF